MKKVMLPLAALFMLSAPPALASIDEALQAMKEKDYNFAASEFNRLITEENNAEAMYNLALMYEQGLGLVTDEAEYMRLLRQSAEAGYDKAALKLGTLYYSGKNGLAKSYPEAYKWFKAAADKGNFTAQYNVGMMTEQGVGDVVQKDLVKAFQYYLKSGKQGYYLAQNALGRMYVEGVGTTQNYARGMAWYRLAADQGHVDSQMKLAELFANINVKGLPYNLAYAHVYYNIVAAYAKSPYREQAINERDSLIQKMQVEEIQAAQQIAQSWKKKNRLESYPPENFDSIAFLDDEVSKKQQEQAERKDEKKPVTVVTKLEDILIETGVSRRDLFNAIEKDDFSKIVEKLNAQVEEGQLLPTVALADLYLLGQGVELDVGKGVDLYKKAVEHGSAIAAFRLAPLYCQGNGVEKSMKECYKYFSLSEKYSDENSRSVTQQAVKLLEENLPEEQVKEWKKELEVYSAVPPESAGVINMFKEKFFGAKDENGEAKPEEKREKPTERQERPASSSDDLPDL